VIERGAVVGLKIFGILNSQIKLLLEENGIGVTNLRSIQRWISDFKLTHKTTKNYKNSGRTSQVSKKQKIKILNFYKKNSGKK